MFHDGERRKRRVLLAKLHPAANVLEVLIASLKLFRVSGQVRVHHADVRVMEAEAYGYGTFITLNRTTAQVSFHAVKRDREREKGRRGSHHPPHDARADALCLHFRDVSCMLGLHVHQQHDAHQPHQLHLTHTQSRLLK